MTVSDLPALENEGPPASPFEFMPAWQFYLPLAPHFIALAFRHGGLTTLTAANPAIPAGGLVGESKSRTLDLVTGPARDLIAPYLCITRSAGDEPPADLEARMARAGVTFPAVAKPDMSCRGAGVRKVETLEDVRRYWALFPAGAELVLQSRVTLEPEAGIFYLRDPETSEASIFSLTLKYTPSVTGDGTSSLRELILADPRARLTADVYFEKPGVDPARIPAPGERVALSFAGNHCRGAAFRDGGAFATPTLLAALDRILKSMPDFHFGRMDVRFESLEKLRKGEGFTIIEINGVGSEATHIWDNRFTLKAAREVLKDQYRIAYEFGAKMKARGAKPTPVFKLMSMWLTERRLTARYPVSD